MKFPFADATNTATLTCYHVLEENEPILYVSHDEEDGMWQFLCGRNHKEEEGRIISLYSAFLLDYSVAEIANMPCGYYAERRDRQSEWKICKA